MTPLVLDSSGVVANTQVLVNRKPVADILTVPAGKEGKLTIGELDTGAGASGLLTGPACEHTLKGEHDGGWVDGKRIDANQSIPLERGIVVRGERAR